MNFTDISHKFRTLIQSRDFVAAREFLDEVEPEIAPEDLPDFLSMRATASSVSGQTEEEEKYHLESFEKAGDLEKLFNYVRVLFEHAKYRQALDFVEQYDLETMPALVGRNYFTQQLLALRGTLRVIHDCSEGSPGWGDFDKVQANDPEHTFDEFIHTCMVKLRTLNLGQECSLRVDSYIVNLNRE